MLERQHRFHGYSSLRKTYTRTKSIRGPFVSLRYAERYQNRPYRVAVVVARKVHKSAVKRNRIRRRIYEIIRTSKNVPSSTDLIFTVYSDRTAEMESAELTSQIEELLKKVVKT